MEIYGLWIPENYICWICSDKESVPIKYVDHFTFIHLNQGKFEEVLSEKDFRERFIRENKLSLPEGQHLYINQFRYQEDNPLLPDFLQKVLSKRD